MALRFAFITTFYPPYAFGGDAIFVRALAHLLADQGHWVEVIHCRDSYQLLRPRQLAPLALTPHPRVQVHTLSSRYGPLSPVLTQATGQPWLKAKKIGQILDRGFDVIHYHNLSLVGGPGLLSLGKGLKLYTSHEYWLHCPTHLLLKYGKQICRSPKNCWTCSLMQRRPPQIWRSTSLMTRGLNHIDLFLSPTHFARELHRNAGLPGPVEVLPNFVPDPGTREEKERGDFLYVGRLEEVKGIVDLVQCFANMPEQRLQVVGDGSLRSDLAARATSNVEFLGFRQGSELSHLYSQARAVLIPSRSYEILPLVLLESMAHSTPFVVANMGELPRIARESKAGLVATEQGQWMESIRGLSQDLSRQLGARGRQYYLKHYTPSNHLRRYLELVERGLARACS